MTTKPDTAAALMLLLMLQWPQPLAAHTSGGNGLSGTWEVLLNNSGVVAMHMALTHLNTVIFFDQTSSGRTGYLLHRNSSCSGRRGGGGGGSSEPKNEGNGTKSSSQVKSCWAHSMEYDVATNTLRPLTLRTDTWCSSSSFLRDGTLQQTGGYSSGIRKIRYFRPCSDGRCDWTESPAVLAEGRWYSTSQILPDGGTEGGADRVFILGGLNVFTYEFVPKSHPNETAYELPFLHQTSQRRDKGNNLYPFIHLSSDGNLFIFANRDSILFDYRHNTVLRTFPRLPGSGARNYPSTGSTVLLPLDHTNFFQRVEVMICGGAAVGAYHAALRGRYYQALSSCGRMVITDEKPEWIMEEMPGPRLMSDMLVLPTGNVLIINGATHGCAGWQKAINPVLTPYLYHPNGKPGERFSVLRASIIPRMYHSTALLLSDGRVLVGGSNPYYRYNFSGYPYKTELRMEAFTPYYMRKFFDDKRPMNVVVVGGEEGIRYGEEFVVLFEMERRASTELEFVASAAPFVTHSLSMHQRVLRMECRGIQRLGEVLMSAVVKAPPSPVVAPAGYYLLTVVNGGIPSKSEWVRFLV
ncbi:hypothetical protein IEQ34_021093 [Dendrobium chrysotoxum]|uniref:Uncharacterized protein n=1 Tax=Dendrobium chrysotoxum TaxID=161865 RepID=A0AAV7G260_DENCH|nr:hypothetical protein IEQ34_021093 [Dendrobium chrysotoxum]